MSTQSDVVPKRRTALASFFFATLMLVLTLAPGSAMAQRPQNVTPGELSLLPNYCVDTQGFNYGDQYFNTSPKAAYWVGLMGPSFWHHHHYCWGLIKMQRARRPGATANAREAGFTGAIGDFDYVIRNATSDFVMLPEVYLRMGDAFLELGDTAQALNSYAGATERKPDYWPAYINAAKVYERVGLKKQALTRLADGLRAAPQEPNLQQAYKRLGGDLTALLKTIPAPTQAQPGASAPAAGTAPR
jgi:tetratricopeptide (TPR) repeat protein